MAKILIIEPFFTGSHKDWALGYREHSKHQVEILSLQGRHWKWRMHGGAISLANAFNNSELEPDLILASDMLDVTSFQALTRRRTAQTPYAVYFHENQLCYPWSPDDPDPEKDRDLHYGFINIISAVSSDAVYFNSHFHLDSFLNECENFFARVPEPSEASCSSSIAKKSKVLPVGLNLSSYKAMEKSDNPEPIILWNHRWEYDKNFDDFFKALNGLKDRSINFKLVVLGESYKQTPESFDRAKDVFAKDIIHWGFVETRDEYAKWLSKSDIIPITSKQDFFGISLLEAVYAGCIPLMPQRLSYPELFPNLISTDHFYSDQNDLVEKLERIIAKIANIESKEKLRQRVEEFSWASLAPIYDEEFSRILSSCKSHKIARAL